MIGIALVLIAGGYLIGKKTMPAPASVQPQAVTQTSTQPSPTIDPTNDIIAAVKKGLIAVHGNDAVSLKISIKTVEEDFAAGSASEQGGGGLWYAARVNGEWILAWDGNGSIPCAQINKYNFPSTMIPTCWENLTQSSVNR